MMPFFSAKSPRARPSDDFLTLSCLLTLGIGTLFLWHIVRANLAHSEAIEHHLDAQSARLERTLHEILDYTHYQSHYLAVQIRDHHVEHYQEPQRLRYIHQLFKSFFRLHPEHSKMMPWNMFSWAEADGRLLVNSEKGILTTPIDVSDREYQTRTRSTPEVMQLSKQSIGKVSGKPIVTATYGTLGSQGQFLGTIIVGIQLERLREKLIHALSDKQTRFALLDKDHAILLQFTTNTLHDLSQTASLELDDLRQRLVVLLKNPQARQTDLLLRPSLWNNAFHAHYTILPTSHYTLLVWMDPEWSRQQRTNLFTLRITEALIVTGVLLLLLRVLWTRLFSPLSMLVETASHEKASLEGQSPLTPQQPQPFSLFKSNAIAILAEQLSNSVATRQQLHTALQELLHLNHAKTVAERLQQEADQDYHTRLTQLAQLANELRFVLGDTINNAEFLAWSTHDTTHSETWRKTWAEMGEYFQFFSMVHQNLHHASQNTLPCVLDVSHIGITDVIDYVVFLTQVQARLYAVTIRVSSSPSLPQLIADLSRVKEMLYHMLRIAILRSHSFTEVEIRVAVASDKSVAIDIENQTAPSASPPPLEPLALPEQQNNERTYFTNAFILRFMQHYARLHDATLVDEGHVLRLTFPAWRTVETELSPPHQKRGPYFSGSSRMMSNLESALPPPAGAQR